MNTIIKSYDERMEFAAHLKDQYEHGEEIRQLVEQASYERIVVLGRKSFVIVFDDNYDVVGTRLGYARVSSEGQATAGYGISIQTSEIINYCRQKGFKLSVLAFDMGISGNNQKELFKKMSTGEIPKEWMKDIRPGLYYVLKHANKNNKILSYNPSRLWRDNDVTGSLLRMLTILQGSDLEFTQHPSITLYEKDNGAYLSNEIQYCIADYDRRETVDKLNKGRHRAAKEGRHMSKVAYGYEIDKQGVTHIVEEQAKVVRLVYSMIDDPKHPNYNKIAQTLTDEGIMRPSGKPWTPQALSNMYKNNRRIYEGWVFSCGEEIFKPELSII